MSSIRAIALLLITASLLAGCNQTTNVETERQRVIVQGSGEVRAAPDSFRVRATASARGDDVSALREQVDRQVDAVLALAERLDIDETQVSARELHVQPEWEHRPERQLLGYRAESRAADSGEYRAGEQTITQRVEVHFELR